MFRITGIYDVKLRRDGSVSRTKHTFDIALNTERGVMAFIEEQKPFAEIAITDAVTKEDKTAYFIGE